jgi:hypothetical protein
MNRFMLNLTELQRRFKAAIFGPSSPLPDALMSRSRFEIYSNAYHSRLEESLAEDFERLRRRVGPEVFSRWVSGYLMAYPSQWASLSELGRNFAQYLSERPDHLDFPYAADLARLEWLEFISVHSRVIERSVDWSELSSLDPGQVVFEWAPGVAVFASNWNLLKRLGKSKTFFLVYTQGGVVSTEIISKIKYEFFSKSLAHASLSELLSFAQAKKISPAEIQSWFAEGSSKRWMTGFLKCPLN